MADSSRDMKSVEMFFKSLLLLQEDEFRQAVAADGRITNQLDEQLAELINNIEFESPFTFSLCLRIIERGMVDIMTFARLVDVSRCYSATQPNVHSLLQSWLLRCESWEAKSKQVVSFAMKKINRLEKRKVIQDTDLDFMIDTISVLKTIFNLNGSFIKENVQCCHAAYQLDTNSEKSRQLKSDILSFLHSMLSSLMQSPDVICEITLELLEENSGTSFMVDAPMVLDYEISFGFSEMLRSCQFSHTPRIEYLIMSLDHIVVLSGNAEKRRERAQALLSNLDTPPLHRDAENEMENIEIISKITALNDIFPDLGMGFLEAVLMDVEQDVELATMQILEKQFSPQVDRLDRQLARKFHILAVPAVAISGNLGNDSDDSSHTAVLEKDMLTERNNVFDGDEFDMMNGNVDMSLVHRGKAKYFHSKIV